MRACTLYGGIFANVWPREPNVCRKARRFESLRRAWVNVWLRAERSAGQTFAPPTFASQDLTFAPHSRTLEPRRQTFGPRGKRLPFPRLDLLPYSERIHATWPTSPVPDLGRTAWGEISFQRPCGGSIPKALRRISEIFDRCKKKVRMKSWLRKFCNFFSVRSQFWSTPRASPRPVVLSSCRRLPAFVPHCFPLTDGSQRQQESSEFPPDFPPISNPVPTDFRPISYRFPTVSLPVSHRVPSVSRPIFNPFPTDFRPFADRFPTDFPPSSERFPTDFQPVSHRFPTVSRSLPDRFPTDFRPFPYRFPTEFRAFSDRFPTRFPPISDRFPIRSLPNRFPPDFPPISRPISDRFPTDFRPLNISN